MESQILSYTMVWPLPPSSLPVIRYLISPGAHRLVTPPDDPFSAPLDNLKASRSVGLDSAYVAVQEALRGFKDLSNSLPTAFIYTGNTLNQIAIPPVLPFALSKVAAAMMIEYGANAYGQKGYRYVLRIPSFLTCKKHVGNRTNI